LAVKSPRIRLKLAIRRLTNSKYTIKTPQNVKNKNQVNSGLISPKNHTKSNSITASIMKHKTDNLATVSIFLSNFQSPTNKILQRPVTSISHSKHMKSFVSFGNPDSQIITWKKIQ